MLIFTLKFAILRVPIYFVTLRFEARTDATASPAAFVLCASEPLS